MAGLVTNRRWFVQALVVCTILGLVGTLGVGAHSTSNITVSLGVGDTNLRVTGKTAPSALVTIQLDGSTIGTAAANVDGDFDVLFLAQVPGLHDLAVYAKDTQNRNTGTVNLSINLTEQAATTADIFLPPILQLGASEVTAGEVVPLQGSGYPGSTVLVIVNDNEVVSTTIAGNGLWSLQLNTTSLEAGYYEVYVKAQDGIYQSYASPKQVFLVNAASAPSPATSATPSVSPIPTPGPTLVPPGTTVDIEVPPLRKPTVPFVGRVPPGTYPGPNAGITYAEPLPIVAAVVGSGLLLIWIAWHRRRTKDKVSHFRSLQRRHKSLKRKR